MRNVTTGRDYRWTTERQAELIAAGEARRAAEERITSLEAQLASSDNWAAGGRGTRPRTPPPSFLICAGDMCAGADRLAHERCVPRGARRRRWSGSSHTTQRSQKKVYDARKAESARPGINM